MRQIAAALFKQLAMLLDHLESTETLRFLLSDAAKYIVAVAAILQSLCPKLFLCDICSIFIVQLCYENQIALGRC